jgi:hypothetical protein
MHLAQDLQSTVDCAPEDFSVFSRHIAPEWILEALVSTKKASVRRRRLPADQVVWLVVGMALMRNESILAIVDRLQLALATEEGKRIAPSAVSQARARLGDEPMEWLFQMLSDAWVQPRSEQDRWRGLSLWTVDGTKLNVADTPDNREAFGVSRSGQGEAPYPMLRLVALMEARTHLIRSVRFGPIVEHERTVAEDLWPEIPEHSLTLVDKGLFSVHRMLDLEQRGRHWLTRARVNIHYRVVKSLGPGDDLIEIRLDPDARKRDRDLPTTHVVRCVHYQRKGFRPDRLITSLHDPEAYPASELVALYHERWEIELGYDEVKCELLEASITLRSQSPVLVRQEFWGILIAYNLVRVEMAHIADEAGVPPTRLSFVTVLRALRIEWDFWGILRTPGTIPQRIVRLRADLARALLPPRRERYYPRAVKHRTSKYPAKRKPTPSPTGRKPK